MLVGITNDLDSVFTTSLFIRTTKLPSPFITETCAHLLTVKAEEMTETNSCPIVNNNSPSTPNLAENVSPRLKIVALCVHEEGHIQN